MNSRPHLQPFLNTSVSIRHEIQRFESVHPSIYAIYDLIELVPDGLLAQQIRDHVVCIEDSFVNSQEWTLSRTVADVRVGVVGTAASGKSALVHRYLTGAYMHEDSPEGGRFKKEVVVDGHSYLLLIRDEGGPPELQFASWVDAVIFVFSLEDETSFNAVYSFYNRMSQYRNTADIPIILVGTQDAINESNPRVVDDAKARKLANDLKRCSYYETCATYGLNVERVFQDACQKIVQQRLSSSTSCLTPGNSRPSTPSSLQNPQQFRPLPNNSSLHGNSSPSHNHNSFIYKDPLRGHHPLSASSHHLHRSAQPADNSSVSSGISAHVEVHNGPDHTSKWPQSLTTHGSSQALVTVATENNNIAKFTAPQCLDNLPPPSSVAKDPKDLPTPSSTPTTSRKSRRRSNLFTPSKKGEDKLKNGELGSGRAIPIKQGYLYKKSSKALNKEWKKKYVTLCDDGRLTYHPSLHDYMEDVNGKEISLQYVTVKVPGQKPRGSKSIITTVPNCHQASNGGDLNDGIGNLSLSGKISTGRAQRATDVALLSAFDVLKEPATSTRASSNSSSARLYLNSTYSTAGQGCDDLSSSSSAVGSLNGTEVSSSKETPNVKKRHRRMKSSGLKKDGEDDADSSYEFTIVSLDGKRWRFEVPASGPSNGSSNGVSTAAAERDSWVASVEQQILASLQGGRGTGASILQCSSGRTIDAPAYIRRVYGNDTCVDCDAADPDWASLNLGVLICIECSGIHRNLGSHISRVRSLDLDEWPLGHVCVMLSLGNAIANSIWEADLRGNIKPLANSSREDKERWIRLKYERRSFLPSMLSPASPSSIHNAASSGDVATLARLLASPAGSNTNISDKVIALRAACAAGHLAAAQLLIWHNINPNIPDSENKTCLHYAKMAVSHLHSVATRPLHGIQLTCPVHAPGGELPSSTTGKATAKLDCYCPIFELLTAQHTAGTLVDLLVNIQNNSIINTISNGSLEQYRTANGQNEPHLGSASSLTGSNGALTSSYGTLGRQLSHGNNLTVNGKYLHNSLTGSMV